MIDTVLLCSGSGLWLTALLLEYVLSPSNRESDAYVAPCLVERRFSGYNFVFVGLPLAVILLAQTRMTNELLGAPGLTCIFETGFLLGAAGYLQIVRLHTAMCLLSGLASVLVCLNFGMAHGAILGGPFVVLSTVLAICSRDVHRHNTRVSAILGLMDAWMVLGRIVLVVLPPDVGWTNHYLFDVICAVALACVAAVSFIVAYFFPCLPFGWNGETWGEQPASHL